MTVSGHRCVPGSEQEQSPCPSRRLYAASSLPLRIRLPPHAASGRRHSSAGYAASGPPHAASGLPSFSRCRRDCSDAPAPAAVAAGTPADANRAAAHQPALDSRGPGYLRLAYLTPGRRPVDVYMYSFGHPGAAVVFRHLGHGTVSRYRAVASGDYTVAVRSAGTAAAAKPVLSATIHVAAGHSYTVAVRPGAVSGFGAAAPKPARSLAVWLVLAFAGLLASVAGVHQVPPVPLGPPRRRAVRRDGNAPRPGRLTQIGSATVLRYASAR